MPSSFTPLLKLELPATGELSGTWGTTVNNAITTPLSEAVAGTTTITVGGSDYTLSNGDGSAANEARKMFIVATGTPGASRNVICPAASKFYVFRNDTNQTLTLKTLSGTGIAVPAGQYRFLYCNGTDVVETFNAMASLTLGTALAAASGGTGQSSYTAGDLLYATGTTALSKLGIGASTTILTSSGTAPQWTAASSVAIGTATNLAGGAAGSVPYQSGAATTTFLGIGAANTVMTSSGTAPQWSTALTGLTGVSTTTATLSGNLTLSGGTANGVLYLDGSKVATSGSALTFDGANFAVNTGSITSGNSTFAGSLIAIGGGSGATIAITPNTISGANGVVYNTSFVSGGAGPHVFQIGGSEQMRLTSTGLGIGTSSPLTRLNPQADNTSNDLGQVTISGSTNSNKRLSLGFHTTSNYGFIQSLIAGDNYYPLVLQGNGGNLGIGTSSPGAKLDINGITQSRGNIYGGVANTVSNIIAYANVATGGVGTSQFLFGNTSSDSRGYFSYSHASDTLLIGTAGATQATLNSSGNLGLGVTPSAWASGYRALQVGATGALWQSTSGFTFLSDNAYVDSGAVNRYITTNFATLYRQQSGQHNWFTAPSGTAGNAISFTQAMTLDSAGNLGLGVTPSAWASAIRALDISAGALAASSATTQISHNAFFDGTFKYKANGFAAEYRVNQGNGSHAWYTAPSGTAGNAISFTQAMTLDADGDLGIGTTSPTAKLNVAAANPTNGVLSLIQNISTSAQTGALVQLDVGNVGSSAVGIPGGSSNALAFYVGGVTSGSERARIDSSGNLGLGVTPSAWSLPSVQSQFGIFAGQSEFNTASNAYFDGAWKYFANGYASRYSHASGIHYWFNSGPGTAGNAISFTQAMTLDASGRLGIGETSPSQKLTVGATADASNFVRVQSSTAIGIFGVDAGGGYVGTDNAYALRLFTNNSERARITSGGYFKASNDGVYVDSAGVFHELSGDGSAETLIIDNSVSASTAVIVHTRGAANFAGTHYLAENLGTTVFQVASNGNVTNTNGSYGTISDAKLKTDIVDASSQWEDLKAVRFRKFRMKNDPSGLLQLGVVAQELEQVSPGLVDEHADRDAEGNDLGTTTKSVKTSVLLMKAAVALQEAMARIEVLEAKVAALEA